MQLNYILISEAIKFFKSFLLAFPLLDIALCD